MPDDALRRPARGVIRALFLIGLTLLIPGCDHATPDTGGRTGAGTMRGPPRHGTRNVARRMNRAPICRVATFGNAGS